ncbi:MAG TPA: hypothetical protein VIG06_02810, partial [Kofleriaceae bacterium]
RLRSRARSGETGDVGARPGSDREMMSKTRWLGGCATCAPGRCGCAGASHSRASRQAGRMAVAFERYVVIGCPMFTSSSMMNNGSTAV